MKILLAQLPCVIVYGVGQVMAQAYHVLSIAEFSCVVVVVGYGRGVDAVVVCADGAVVDIALCRDEYFQLFIFAEICLACEELRILLHQLQYLFRACHSVAGHLVVALMKHEVYHVLACRDALLEHGSPRGTCVACLVLAEEDVGKYLKHLRMTLHDVEAQRDAPRAPFVVAATLHDVFAACLTYA